MHIHFAAGNAITVSSLLRMEVLYMKVLDRIALALVIIGALNWGAVGLFRFDCVAALFGGQAAPISRIIYALVGLAGLWCITILFRDAPAEA